MEATKTAEQVRGELRRKGITIARWSRENGFTRSIVYGLLYGRLTGTYGQAHKAAVLLKLKDGEIIS
jgi:gp16 family phage-associated protein